MKNNNLIDDVLSPISKWLATSFFNEKKGRTLSQKVEDEMGIPKDIFHIGLGIVGIILLGNSFRLNE